jgi:hypothetical protein
MTIAPLTESIAPNWKSYRPWKTSAPTVEFEAVGIVGVTTGKALADRPGGTSMQTICPAVPVVR